MITQGEFGKLLARHARRACLHPCMMNGRARKRGSGPGAWRTTAFI